MLVERSANVDEEDGIESVERVKPAICTIFSLTHTPCIIMVVAVLRASLSIPPVNGDLNSDNNSRIGTSRQPIMRIYEIYSLLGHFY